jgi:hypothetical protein
VNSPPFFLFSFYVGDHAPRNKLGKWRFGEVDVIFSILGLVIFGVGGAALWYLRPTDGHIHPLMKFQFLDTLIPVAIVTALAIGMSMTIAGLLG